MRFSNWWQLLSVMESYPILITLIKTFNFWLFLPVTDRLFCVLSLVHSYSRAQVARWLLPRLVWPLRRVYSRHTAYTAQSCPDTTPVNISHPHTAGTHTTAEQCGWRFRSFHSSLFPFYNQVYPSQNSKLQVSLVSLSRPCLCICRSFAE